MSSHEGHPEDAAQQLRALLARVADDGEASVVEELIDGLDPRELQAAMTTLGRTFVSWYERGEHFAPVSERITATEAVMLCHGILDAADLEVFELGLWRPLRTLS